MSKWLMAVLLSFALAPVSLGQRGGGNAAGVGFGRGRHLGHSRSRGFGRNVISFGDPFWFDDYPSGSMASAGPVQPVPAVPRSSAFTSEPERITAPLLIEWQGDRYVRVAAAGNDKLPDYSQVQPLAAESRRTELPPAVLIFRDGHQEEVSDYVITRGVLYAQGEYALTGATTRDIQLAALDFERDTKGKPRERLKFRASKLAE